MIMIHLSSWLSKLFLTVKIYLFSDFLLSYPLNIKFQKVNFLRCLYVSAIKEMQH